MSLQKNKTLLLDSYVVVEKIGSGSFGDVYLAKRKRTNTMVAIKVEEKKKASRMENEYKIYKRLHKNGMNIGIPQIHDFMQTPTFNVMCMQLLGPSLEDVFNKCARKFSTNTTLKLGISIIGLLKNFHNNRFIHRDIKPNNFLIGRTDEENQVFLMDFGLSKQYIDKKMIHNKFREGRSLIGTARYASINMHMGIEPSRRDDLESVGYMLVYFAQGSLPWQGLKKKKNQSNIETIGDVKLCTNLSHLCDGLPDCFMEYIIYCRKLKYEEDPDYDYLIDLFDKYYKENGSPEYEWVTQTHQKSSSNTK